MCMCVCVCVCGSRAGCAKHFELFVSQSRARKKHVLSGPIGDRCGVIGKTQILRVPNFGFLLVLVPPRNTFLLFCVIILLFNYIALRARLPAYLPTYLSTFLPSSLPPFLPPYPLFRPPPRPRIHHTVTLSIFLFPCPLPPAPLPPPLPRNRQIYLGEYSARP